jgi:hypothetical protein
MNDTICALTIKQSGFEFKHQSIPSWIESLNWYYRGLDEGNILMLFEQTQPLN